VTGSKTFLIVGANHKDAPELLRDRLQGTEADQLRLAMRCREIGLDQVAVMATCDRCEVWTAVDDAGAVAPKLAELLAEAADLPVTEIGPQLHLFSGGPALRYAFAVAASLESQIVGEPQVLAQVKDAHRLASRSGMLGPELDAVFRAALSVGKKVRSDTDIAQESVSMAACVTKLCRQVFGAPSHVTGLILGDSELGEFIMQHLTEAGLTRWTVVHRSAERAASWAARHRGAHAATLDELPRLLPAADITLGALDGPRVAVSAEQVKAAFKARRRAPMLFVDLAVPGDVDPKVNDVDDAFLYSLDDLERLAMRGRHEREAAAKAAWEIVDLAVAAYEQAADARSAAPALSALKAHFDAERERLLTEQPGLDAAEATRRLISRLLHRPMVALRDSAPDSTLEDAALALFGIGETAPKDAKEE
jgi:glutamyl-tRNA reductase